MSRPAIDNPEPYRGPSRQQLHFVDMILPQPWELNWAGQASNFVHFRLRKSDQLGFCECSKINLSSRLHADITWARRRIKEMVTEETSMHLKFRELMLPAFLKQISDRFERNHRLAFKQRQAAIKPVQQRENIKRTVVMDGDTESDRCIRRSTSFGTNWWTQIWVRSV